MIWSHNSLHIMNFLQHFSDSFEIMVGSNSLNNPGDVYEIDDIVTVSFKKINSIFYFQIVQRFLRNHSYDIDLRVLKFGKKHPAGISNVFNICDGLGFSLVQCWK